MSCRIPPRNGPSPSGRRRRTIPPCSRSSRRRTPPTAMPTLRSRSQRPSDARAISYGSTPVGPYIDLAAPLVATLDSGITLPSASGITGVRSRTANGCTEPIDVVSRTLRDDADYWPSVYIINTALLLRPRRRLERHRAARGRICAGRAGVRIDCRLLPTPGRRAAGARGESRGDARTPHGAEIPGTQVDLGAYQATVAQAEAQFLATLILSRRARRVTLRGDSDYA
jgi:hypothetical protein